VRDWLVDFCFIWLICWTWLVYFDWLLGLVWFWFIGFIDWLCLWGLMIRFLDDVDDGLDKIAFVSEADNGFPWLKPSFFHLNLSGNGVQFHNNLLHLSKFWLLQSILFLKIPFLRMNWGLVSTIWISEYTYIYNIYIWIYQLCRSNLHIVGYTSIISILGCRFHLPYLHYKVNCLCFDD